MTILWYFYLILIFVLGKRDFLLKLTSKNQMQYYLLLTSQGNASRCGPGSRWWCYLWMHCLSGPPLAPSDPCLCQKHKRETEWKTRGIFYVGHVAEIPQPCCRGSINRRSFTSIIIWVIQSGTVYDPCGPDVIIGFFGLEFKDWTSETQN